MATLIREPAFLDYGNAPELFANGLHDVELQDGIVRFVLYVERTQAGERVRVPPFTCIMPLENVGPGIGLVIRRLGTRLILPTMAKHVLLGLA